LVTAAVFQKSNRVLIAQRPAEGLLGSLWEFPGGKQQPGEDLSACLQREIREELGIEVEVSDLFGVYRHAYTHFRVTLHAFRCRLCNGAEPRPLQAQALLWVEIGKLDEFPMGKIDRQISRNLARTRATC
jgi:A/G-specific adenine glycosylase